MHGFDVNEIIRLDVEVTRALTNDNTVLNWLKTYFECLLKMTFSSYRPVDIVQLLLLSSGAGNSVRFLGQIDTALFLPQVRVTYVYCCVGLTITSI